MSRLKTRIKFLPIIFWVVLVISFIFFALLIVLKANGYILNWRTGRIVKTGMLYLSGTPADVNIKLNNRVLNGLPARIRELRPGTYEIEITKIEYWSWQKTVKIEPGMATSFDQIVLFKTKPEDTLPPDNYDQEDLQQDFQDLSQDIQINGSEIYLNDKLISRFSGDVASAVLYPDKNHLIFQMGKEIRVIDLDGSNNHLLLTLNTSLATPLAIQKNGTMIIYLEGSVISAKIIR